MVLAISDGGTGASTAAGARSNLATDLAANVNFTPAGTGAVTRSLQDKLSGTIDLADYGFVGDGVTDDTAAWQDAIAAATAAKARTIRVPWGETGISLVEGQIVNGALPSGLAFEGEALAGGDGTIVGARLKYTGSDTCWFIDVQISGSQGRWLWRNLAFEATDPGATMFDFNDVLGHGTVCDESEYSYLEHVRFESCYFVGAGGGGDQTGDAIRGAKMFQLVVDENCFFIRWRRAVWLHGCDNCTLRMRAYLNARNLMIEASGTFANDNIVESRFLGAPGDDTSEDSYLIWDNANSTTYLGCYLEDPGVTASEDALLHIDGLMTSFVAPHFGLLTSATCPLFHLGSSAREILMLHPKLSTSTDAWAPAIDDPADTGLGYPYAGYYMMIVGANVHFQRTVGTHPRLRWIGAQRGRGSVLGEDREMVADASGYRPRQSILSALNFWDGPYPTLVGGVTAFEPDADASQGWAMRCDHGNAGAGFAPKFIIGEDFMPGDKVRVAIRAKSTAGSGWGFVRTINGGSGVAIASLASLGSGYSLIEGVIDLTGLAVGDELGVLIYNSSASVDLVVDYVAATVAHGISFPATQVALADANTLDDYEEGTFTPALKFGGNSTGMTGTFNGYYTKIGNRVFFNVEMALSAKGSSTGLATVVGLPFTNMNATNTRTACALYCEALASVAAPMAYLGPNSSTIVLYNFTASSAAAMTDGNFSNTSDVMISGSYSV